MRATARKLLALTSAGTTLALTTATVALATAPSGETPTPLARGTLNAPANVNVKVNGGNVRIKTQGRLDALVLEITLAPGGNRRLAQPRRTPDLDRQTRHADDDRRPMHTSRDPRGPRHDQPRGINRKRREQRHNLGRLRRHIPDPTRRHLAPDRPARTRGMHDLATNSANGQPVAIADPSGDSHIEPTPTHALLRRKPQPLERSTQP
jgi:hypothetical protein